MEEITLQNTYEEKTLGIITSSKSKSFNINPLYYKLRYIDLIKPEEVEETRAMTLGTAFHYIMEFGSEKFLEKYYIEHASVKEPYRDMILNRFREQGMLETDIQAQEKRLKSTTTTLEKLRLERHGAREIAMSGQKIPLTSSEGKRLIKMYERAVRQRSRDLAGKYSKEERVEGKRQKLTIGMKPDRIVFMDRHDRRYTIQEVQAIQHEMSFQEKLDRADREGMRGMIRDFKTTGSIKKDKDDLLSPYKEDTRFAYVYSMAFYYTVAYATYGIKCEVYIDYIETVRPHATEVIALPASMLEDKYNQYIRPTLLKIQEAEETGIYQQPSRDQILDNRDLKQYYDYFENATSDEIFYLSDHI